MKQRLKWLHPLRSTRGWLPTGLVIVGLAITTGLFGTLDARREHVTRIAFEAEAGERVGVLKNRLHRIFEAVHSLAAFYQGSREEVTWEEFQAFAEPVVKRHPGLKVLFWVPQVPGEQREAFEAFAPPPMAEPIRIREQTPEEGLVPAGERPAYFPISYIWPAAEYDWLLGFDLASREETGRAMAQSRKQQRVMATRPIDLVSDRDIVRSVWVFHAVQGTPLPVEAVGELEGFVGGAFDTNEMLAGIMPVFGPQDMVLEIRDADAPSNQSLIYSSRQNERADAEAATNAGSGAAVDAGRLPLYTDVVEVAGRRWQILAQPTLRYLEARETWTLVLLLVGGTVLSLLLGFYLHTVLARRDRVEWEVTQRTEELRREIEQRRRYADALARSNQELEHFAYIASHDLQEPLRKIQGFGDMLRTQAGEALDATARDYLRRMEDAASRMRALIQGLLSYSRITTQAQPFERVDLGRVAGQVVDDLAMRIRETNGEVHIDALPEIEADPLQMRQLLQNLIGNALKFHREDVTPEVWVTGECNDGRLCRIRVRDNGIGFGPQEAERLFKPFQRLHSRTAYEGTGMGLAVCLKIAERHGGTITTDSTPSEGSTFTVTLPRREAREEAAVAA